MPRTESTEESLLTASVDEHLDRLLSFEPCAFPVISLYLNTQADNHGRDRYEQFVRKELQNHARTFSSGSAEAQSFQQDVERIDKFLSENLEASANGVAIFACSAADLFETIQMNVPVEEHRLYVYNQPHLYHLAYLDDAYPRYAALLTDANSARIYMFGLGETIETEAVKGKKVQRVKVGGWSQARYQRRVKNAHADHAKELVSALERMVREEGIKHIILSGDVTILSVLREQMPKDVADRIVDTVSLDLKASDQEVFEATLARMREEDAKTDAEAVERLFQLARARGLACLGPEAVLEALTNGQVDELLLSGALDQQNADPRPVDAVIAPEIPDSQGGTDSDEPREVLLADLLVTKAKQTDARIRFIEDAGLLEAANGVGAFLRWR
jgi:peptide subunit release factor 1 (eRF1)